MHSLTFTSTSSARPDPGATRAGVGRPGTGPAVWRVCALRDARDHRGGAPVRARGYARSLTTVSRRLLSASRASVSSSICRVSFSSWRSEASTSARICAALPALS